MTYTRSDSSMVSAPGVMLEVVSQFMPLEAVPGDEDMFAVLRGRVLEFGLGEGEMVEVEGGLSSPGNG